MDSPSCDRFAEMESYFTSVQHAVVVVGGMNPTIHYPQWYRYAALISDAEVEQAINNETASLVITPDISQFACEAFQVNVQRHRWQILTLDTGQFQRIEDCAARVFDDLLPHTPVSKVGLNYALTIELPVESVGKRLASLALKTQLPLPATSPISAAVHFTDQRERYALKVVLEPGNASNLLQIKFNGEFVSPERNDTIQFSIGQAMSEFKDELRTECMDVGKRIADYITE